MARDSAFCTVVGPGAGDPRLANEAVIAAGGKVEQQLVHRLHPREAVSDQGDVLTVQHDHICFETRRKVPHAVGKVEGLGGPGGVQPPQLRGGDAILRS